MKNVIRPPLRNRCFICLTLEQQHIWEEKTAQTQRAITSRNAKVLQ